MRPVRRQATSASTSYTLEESKPFSGPIPSPEVLEGYEQLLPGAAERILAMAENYSAHQIAMDEQGLKYTARDVRTGQWFALVVTISAFLTSGVLAWLDHPVAAATVGGATVVGLVTVFVTGRAPQNRQNGE